MSKQVLSISISILWAAALIPTAAAADVHGSFDIHIKIEPQTAAYETSPMAFDFEAHLKLDLTRSGLTLSQDLTYGIAGIEHSITGLEAALGALKIFGQLAFAVPYVGATISAWGGLYHSETVSLYTGGLKVGPLLFVKKRVSSEINLGGVSFYNLFMLEDVSFPNPYLSGFSDRDGDGLYTHMDQGFGVGDLITVSGTTPSGVYIISQTGLCADWWLSAYYPKHQLLKIFASSYGAVKKYSWLETVEADCYGEEPIKPALAFTKEVISVQSIPLPSGILADVVGAFSTVPYMLEGYPWNCPMGAFCSLPSRQANIPFFIDTVIQVPIAGLADLLIELWTDDIDSISVDKLVITFQLPEHGWAISWYDNGGDLAFTEADELTFRGSLTLQGAFRLDAFAALRPTMGLERLEVRSELPLSGPEGGLGMVWSWASRRLSDDDGDGAVDEDPEDGFDNDGDGRLDEDPAEGLGLGDWAIRASLGGAGYAFKMVAVFGESGFKAAGLTIGVSW